MRFPYTGFPAAGRTVFRPTAPVTFSVGKRRVSIGRAIVDTGADRTLLPLDIGVALGFTFDLGSDAERWHGAGGGTFAVFKSPVPVDYLIAQEGFRPYHWKAHVYFTLEQPCILLGHEGCLDRFTLIFRGRERVLDWE